MEHKVCNLAFAFPSFASKPAAVTVKMLQQFVWQKMDQALMPKHAVT